MDPPPRRFFYFLHSKDIVLPGWMSFFVGSHFELPVRAMQWRPSFRFFWMAAPTEPLTRHPAISEWESHKTRNWWSGTVRYIYYCTQCTVYTFRKVKADFIVFDWWRYCNALWDVKFCQIAKQYSSSCVVKVHSWRKGYIKTKI